MRQVRFVRPLLPARHRFLALHFLQRPELVGQRVAVVAQVGVVAQQVVQPGPGGRGQLDARRRAHPRHQRQRQREPSDAHALAFDIQRPREVEGFEHRRDARLEVLLRGLRHARQRAQQRALVVREIFQVEHLRTARGQRVQHARLRAAGGAADHAQVEPGRQRVDLRDHMPAKALVAARELLRVPAHEPQPRDHRAAAHAAAPAVHQRLPVLGPVGQRVAQVARDVGRDHRAADAPRLEGAGLHVDGADDAALLVVEHGAVDGAGNVVERELGRRAGVDQRVEGVAVRHPHGLAMTHGRNLMPPIVGPSVRRTPARGRCASGRSQSPPA
jgi:hypothetical protein